jgi:phospholipid-translocating ATPase
MYFLIIGVIMALGWYTPLFESAISPWTTLGPLAFVISISLLQEGSADLGRHRSDMVTNNHRCVVLRRANELEEENGERDSSLLNGQDVDVNIEKSYNLGPSMHGSEGTCRIAFESVKRMDIRQGNIVLIRNREMVPADFVLLASSADNGNAYIETSSIDGETNLKLRATPTMPKEVLDELHRQSAKNVLQEESKKVIRETLEQATKRICRITALGFPNGPSALENPANPSSEYHGSDDDIDDHQPSSGFRLLEKTGNVAKRGAGAVRGMRERVQSTFRVQQTALVENEVMYVTVLKTEPPNASVNTFNGLLILPPVVLGGPSIEIPLNAENILLRGAVLRNTEWAIGIACYTGKDTKLVMNSFDTPSKFSRLDQLMNRIVVYVLCITAAIITYLSTFSVITSNKEFDELWYVPGTLECVTSKCF